MATEVTTQDGAIGRAATIVEAAQGELSGLVSGLDAELAGLAGRWVGAGGASFHTAMARWTQATGRIVGALTGFGESLVATQATYDETDDGQRAGYARFAARLG